MYYGLSEAQAYFKEKVSVFVALAPVTKIPNTQDFVLHFACDFYDLLDDTLSLLGIHALLRDNWLTSTTTALMCNHLPHFCVLIEEMFATADPAADNLDRFQVYMGHFPNGTSVRALLHYAQDIKEDRFQVWAPDFNTFLHIG